MAVLACRVLAVCPSEASRERIFNIFKGVSSDKRADNFNMGTFEALILLNMNFDFSEVFINRKLVTCREKMPRTYDTLKDNEHMNKKKKSRTR